MASQFEFDVHEYWRILRRRKWWAVLGFLSVLGCVMYITFQQTAEWQAVVTMRVSSQAPMATIQGTTISYYGMRSGLDTETKLIEEANSLHAQVLEHLRKECKDAPHEALPSDLTERGLRNKITAEQVEQSDLIRITVTEKDPDLVVRLTNTLAKCYREQYISTRTREAQEKMNLIKGNLEAIDKGLKKAEDELKNIEKKDHAAGTSTLYRTRLAEVDIELTTALQKYTEEHPAVVKLISEKRSLERKLQDLPAKELERTRLKTRIEQITELQQELQKQLFAAQVDYQARKEEITQKISILSNAEDTVQKVRPNETSNAVVGTILGAMIGVILCFVVEALDTSIGTIEDVERFTGLTVLGLIPYVSRGATAKTAAAQPNDDPTVALRQRVILTTALNPVMSEAYRALRTNVQFVLSEKPGNQAILIASAGPNEGKTMNAFNLSVVLAQTGSRTLLVDGDLRHPMIHRVLGVPRGPGLSDLLIGKVPPEEAVRGTEDLLMGALDWDRLVGTHGLDNFAVMTCGAYCPNPTELFASKKTERMLAELKKTWEYIVLDCAPIIPVADATILGSCADGVLMVYQVGKSSRHMLLRAMKQIQVGKSKLLGIVLNQIESDIQFHSYKYYRSPRAAS